MVNPFDIAWAILKQWEDVDWEQPEKEQEPQLGDDVDWRTAWPRSTTNPSEPMHYLPASQAAHVAHDGPVKTPQRFMLPDYNTSPRHLAAQAAFEAKMKVATEKQLAEQERMKREWLRSGGHAGPAIETYR